MEESTEQSNASGKQNYLEEVIRESASRLGYKELKHEQMKAKISLVQGNDTFVAFSANRLREIFNICGTAISSTHGLQ